MKNSQKVSKTSGTQIMLASGEMASTLDLQIIGQRVLEEIINRVGKISAKKLSRIPKNKFAIEVVNAHLP